MARKLTVAAIPDTHFPWVNEKALEQCYNIISDIKPDVIIQLGDLYDRFSFSRFARHQDIMTPKEEIESAYEYAFNFWKACNKLAKRNIQIRGNHDDRLIKQACERFPEVTSVLMKADADLYKFSGVETINDSREGVWIEDVFYHHGYLTQLGAHMRSIGANVVHGHTHRGGAITELWLGKPLFELDCGYLADKNAAPLKYGPTVHTRWTLGLGVVDKNGPRFICLEKP